MSAANALPCANQSDKRLCCIQDVTKELSGMAEICCEAVADGLRTVQATSLADLKEALTMQRTMLHMVQRLHHRITTGLVTTNGPALGLALGRPALEVVMAGYDVTMRLQEAVLCPDCLSSGLGKHSSPLMSCNYAGLVIYCS